MIHDLTSPIDHENGGFPFVARMEQSVIRVSSFTHAVASATPHATFLDSASLHPGYNAKAHPHAHYFQRRHRGRRVRGILNQNSFLRPSAPPRLATRKPEDLKKDSATRGSEQFQPCRRTGREPETLGSGSVSQTCVGAIPRDRPSQRADTGVCPYIDNSLKSN